MKLLAISTSCFTATNREFYRRLQSKGIEVSLVIPKKWNFGKGELEAEPKTDQDPTLFFLEPTKYHHRLYQLKGIKGIVKTLQPDVIYLEGDPGSIMSVILSRQAKKYHSRFFALSCENLSQNPLAVIKREGKGQLINASIKYSLIQIARQNIDTLFVINDQGLAYFKQLGFKNVVKTPLGFNEQVFHIDDVKRSKTRELLKLKEDTIVIAYFGRLVYEKGVHLLIEALEKLCTKNWIFLIDEFGRYKSDYQAKIESMIGASNFKHKTIFFEADHSEIANYMNASDITVLPSIPTKKWVEQYGRVVPEAMACGNRLIVSNVGAQKDFFEDDYYFKYSPEAVDQLANLLERAMEEIRNGDFDRTKYASISQEKYNLEAQLKVFRNELTK